MSSTFLNVINFAKNKDSLHLIAVTGDNLVNSNFVVTSFFQLFKSNAGLRLNAVLLSDSFTNYSRLCAKVHGINLKSFKESGALNVIDFLCDYTKTTFDFKKFTDNVFASINKDSSVVLIDDISCLLYCGVSLSEIYEFIYSLRSVCEVNGVCLVIQSFYDTEDDDNEFTKIVNSIIECSDLWIETKKLESGYSTRIDGSIIFYDWNCVLDEEVKKHFHFKSHDRYSKLLAPGLF